MEVLIISIFVLGYAAIALEHPLKINKAASALLTGVLVWTVFVLFSPDKQIVSQELTDHLGNLSGILFFLLGAMTIVELIDAHDGFEVILLCAALGLVHYGRTLLPHLLHHSLPSFQVRRQYSILERSLHSNPDRNGYQPTLELHILSCSESVWRFPVGLPVFTRRNWAVRLPHSVR